MLIGLSAEELRLIAIALSEQIISLRGGAEALTDQYLTLLGKIDRHRALPE